MRKSYAELGIRGQKCIPQRIRMYEFSNSALTCGAQQEYATGKIYVLFLRAYSRLNPEEASDFTRFII